MIVIDPANSNSYHSIEKDIEDKLKQSAQRSGLTFKSFIIQLLKSGIDDELKRTPDHRLIRRC